jgi:hypothetical protein
MVLKLTALVDTIYEDNGYVFVIKPDHLVNSVLGDIISSAFSTFINGSII